MELDFIDISRPEQTGDTQAKRSGQGRPGSMKTAQARALHQKQLRQKEREKRRRKRRMIKGVILLCELGFIILLCGLLYNLIRSIGSSGSIANVFDSGRREVISANDSQKPELTEDFLTLNEFSRPGDALGKINNIFVHYTANQGTTAAQNRSYFENLGITGETSASAHFVIGYSGEIVQCIPLNEIGYAVMGRNYDSISIECCYLDADGKFTEETYQSLIRLSAWLLKEYKLTPEDMRRHYDEGGKKCPLYYVEHEDAWEQFLIDLREYIMKEQI